MMDILINIRRRASPSGDVHNRNKLSFESGKEKAEFCERKGRKEINCAMQTEQILLHT